MHGVIGANINVNLTDINVLSANRYKKHDSNDTYLVSNVFRHCANAIQGTNGGSTSLYGRIVFDKCYSAIGSINQGFVNVSSGLRNCGQFVFNVSNFPIFVRSGSLLEINMNNPSNDYLKNQYTSINALTSITSTPQPTFFSATSCTVSFDGNAAY